MCGGAAAGVMAELSEEALLSVLPTIRVPKAGDRVHKDECAFSFDTPVSPFPTPAASTTSSIALVILPGPARLELPPPCDAPWDL